MKEYRRLLPLAALLVLALSFGTAQAGAISDRLNDSEKARLENREVICRSAVSADGAKCKANAFAVVQVSSKDDVWKVLQDHEHLPEFMPRLTKTVCLKQTTAQSLVEFEMDATIAKLNYTLIRTLSADRTRLDWVLDRSRPHKYFKVNEGYYQLEELAPGRYLIEYMALVEMDLGVLSKVAAKVTADMTGEDLPSVLDGVRKRIESGGVWKR